jgi:hypothetical protein
LLKGTLVFGKAVFTGRGRRVLALGVAGLGACAVLAACSPVKMGSAAIVGDQRITVSSLDTQVANLQTAAKPYGKQLQLPPAEMPTAVLSWLIRFAVMNEAARAAGITVTAAQSQQALDSINAQAAASASQNGLSGGAREVLVNAGIPPQLMPQVGTFVAQEIAIEEQANGGKMPTTQAESNKAGAVLTKSQCTAAKTLSIQVSPQFGRMDYSQLPYSVVPAPDLLSRPAGVPTPASTTGLVPAC